MITRIIVEDCNGRTILSGPMEEKVSEEEMRLLFSEQLNLPVWYFKVDEVGCALIRIGKPLPIRN